MMVLGLETSCDETAAAVVKDGRTILSNVVFSSLKEHRPFGGVVPEIASRSHLETILPCLKAALQKAKINPAQIDLIAVTQGPGLMGSLLVGLSAAKALALGFDKPLVGVDHVMAHLYAGFLSKPDLRFPFLGLVVSGGHTLLARLDSPSHVRILGQTRDDAVGEAFDKVAKILSLGYPGGPEVDRLSRGQDPNQFFFTRPFLSEDSLDFSFSGIKTAVFYEVERWKKKKPLTLSVKKKIAAGFQEAVCDVLVKKTLFAAKRHELRTVVVGGGVSANSRLRQKLKTAAQKDKIEVIFPSIDLCQDNAAMIASLGAALYKEGRRDTLDLSSYPEFYHGN
jgi:N6-L-threonylcarbamoyladenine synthase